MRTKSRWHLPEYHQAPERAADEAAIPRSSAYQQQSILLYADPLRFLKFLSIAPTVCVRERSRRRVSERASEPEKELQREREL